MKVIALGGGGDMGQWAARTVLDDPRVSELVIADRDGAAAAAVADRLGPRASAVVLDVQDVQDGAALRSLLRGATVLMNTVGPFFRFGVPVLRAAMDAGCHLVDICDDWEPTLDMLALDRSAREAGITAVIGMGASPGLSNLAAVKAAAALDGVHSVYTGWSLDGAAAALMPGVVSVRQRRGPSAATVHGVHQMTGTIRARTGGQDADVKPLQAMHLSYPGLGRRRVWTIGHPEAVTLPLHGGEGWKACANVTFTGRASMGVIKALMAAVDHGWLTADRGARWLEGLAALSPPALPQPWASANHAQGLPIDLPPLFALAMGEHEGQAASAAVAFTSGPGGGMGAVTGIPLALGVSLLLDRIGGSSPGLKPGVFSPEAMFLPDELFARLLPYCDPQPASVNDLALLTTSWQDEPLAAAIQRVRRQVLRSEG